MTLEECVPGVSVVDPYGHAGKIWAASPEYRILERVIVEYDDGAHPEIFRPKELTKREEENVSI